MRSRRRSAGGGGARTTGSGGGVRQPSSAAKAQAERVLRGDVPDDGDRQGARPYPAGVEPHHVGT